MQLLVGKWQDNVGFSIVQTPCCVVLSIVILAAQLAGISQRFANVSASTGFLALE
jgi:hypothetical protein